jgi:crossover junction endodeoxyribonuclease RuvC
MLDANDVNLVVFEAPILPRETSLSTARKLYGLAWHTEYVCWMRKIECFEVHLQSVKKYITGNGRADKRQMMDSVKRLGFDAATYDEADAIGVRLYTLCERFPQAHRDLGFDLGLLGATS